MTSDSAYCSLNLPKVFRPDTSARAFVVETGDALHEAVAPNDRLIFPMDRYDAPAPVINSKNKGAELDYGSRGPQHRPDAQLRPFPC